MKSWTRYALPCAGLIAATATGCASTRDSRASNPTASGVSASQERSHQALTGAADAQKRASEQQRRATEAQENVRDAQRRLDEAQRRAETEAAKARQAQQEANESARQASLQAEEAQQQATRQLTTQQRIVARGEQLIAGQVTRSSPNQIVVVPRGGEAMTFAITPDTRVEIDGRQASAAEIVQGRDVRVAYDATGSEPTARSVQIVTGNAAGTNAPAPQRQPDR